MSIFYGMVTTSGSKKYTPLALKSFFETTKLNEADKFFLFDNDGDFEGSLVPVGARIEVIKNSTPKSFAQNVNQLLDIARETKADIFFLNNDLVFTPNWGAPFQTDAPIILSPVSNREIQYETAKFKFTNVLSLEDFLANQVEFEEAIRIHKTRNLTAMDVVMLPFFCVKLPVSVYSVVGMLDEEYGRGGGEDNDYCVRAVLAGFRIKYILASFVLHFNGRSTWGVETKEATEERCKLFTEHFTKKWGSHLTRFSIQNDLELLNRAEVQPHLARRDFQAVIKAIASFDGITL